MRILGIIVVVCVGVAGVFAAKQPDAGESLFKSKQFAKAKSVYEGLLKQRPADQTYNFRYAACCFETKDYELALKHLLQVNARYPMRDLYLARTYYQTYHFDEAVKAYGDYTASLKPGEGSEPAEILQEKQRAEMAADLIRRVDDIAIVDSMQVDKSDFLRFYKKGSELGTLQAEQMKMPGRKIADRVKYTTQRGDRMLFSDSVKGNMNLYSKYKLLDSWSEPVALPSVINSSANENYPFLLLDGITVYFASDGPKSLGGYDIFVTRYTPGNNTYLEPENVGFPFNSLANDYMMVIDDQHHLGWFVTDRNQPSGKVVVYSFIPNQVKKPARLQDVDSLIGAAKLKIYRKGIPKQYPKVTLPAADGKKEVSQMEFVVNDSLIYTKPEQFKSEIARSAWDELLKMQNELKLSSDSLDEMRVHYGEASDVDSKGELLKQIPLLEQKTIELKRNIQAKINRIRAEELKALR